MRCTSKIKIDVLTLGYEAHSTYFLLIPFLDGLPAMHRQGIGSKRASS